MYTIKQLSPLDIFKLDTINLDKYSESFGLDYYLYYMKTYSEDCYCITNSDNIPVGYVLSKLESKINVYNSHLSAISISPSYRRYKLGYTLMNVLEHNGRIFNCMFVDLFVRKSNNVAYNFYNKLGYYKYRTVYKYYNDEEDAYDMRKVLRGDTHIGQDIHADEL